MKDPKKLREFLLLTLDSEDMIAFITIKHAEKFGNGLKDVQREMQYLSDLSKEELCDMCVDIHVKLWKNQ
jgi:hypothetical protein